MSDVELASTLRTAAKFYEKNPALKVLLIMAAERIEQLQDTPQGL